MSFSVNSVGNWGGSRSIYRERRAGCPRRFLCGASGQSDTHGAGPAEACVRVLTVRGEVLQNRLDAAVVLAGV